MTYFDKRYHPPGTPPGTLTPTAEAEETALRLHLVDYTKDDLYEQDDILADDCRPFLDRPTITWIHAQGAVDPQTLNRLGSLFGLHALALEDVLNTGQRPKVDAYDDQLFIVMRHPEFADGLLVSQQISIFLGRDFVISFCSGTRDPFGSVRHRLRARSGRMRSAQADYLVYALLDLVIDQGFPVLEGFGETLEKLEEELLEVPSSAAQRSIHQTKRELLLLRRTMWPQREALNVIARGDSPLIREETKLYLRDCYDHTVQILDLLETYREMATGMQDLYLSSVSNRLNEAMRVLTVIATMFIPLTFIAGIYGMNFENPDSPWAMPELGWYYGYPALWLVMIMVALALLLYFKRKRWF